MATFSFILILLIVGYIAAIAAAASVGVKLGKKTRSRWPAFDRWVKTGALLVLALLLLCLPLYYLLPMEGRLTGGAEAKMLTAADMASDEQLMAMMASGDFSGYDGQMAERVQTLPFDGSQLEITQWYRNTLVVEKDTADGIVEVRQYHLGAFLNGIDVSLVKPEMVMLDYYLAGQRLLTRPETPYDLPRRQFHAFAGLDGLQVTGKSRAIPEGSRITRMNAGISGVVIAVPKGVTWVYV